MPIRTKTETSGLCAAEALANDHAWDKESEERLVNELKYLSTLVANFSPPASRHSMVIARLVEGLDPAGWRQLANRHSLDSWLGIPMEGDEANLLEQLHKRIESLAFQRDHDSLTSLPNRRAFEERFHVEFERARRTASPLSLAMLDLDNFKNVNDSFGHACGDIVLCVLGKYIIQSLRSYDFAARIGGEEFVILLPGVTIDKAKKQAERLLAAFSKEIFECVPGKPFQCTFSCGIAGIAESEGIDSKAELLAQADNAMYDAKRQGKNRVLLSGACARVMGANTLVKSDEKKFLFSLLGGQGK